MRLLRTIILTTLLMLVGPTGLAQIDHTQDFIFDSNVRSLKMSLQGNPYIPPIYVLGNDERLVFNFDYLDYDVHYLRYSVLHCDANWNPSQLLESEYVDGFNYADIETYALSQATFTQYCNYTFVLPNENMNITKSGNYLVRVYAQDDSDNVLFQKRFTVCENIVGVLVEATSRTDVDYNNEHQQVSFELSYKQGTIRDPYNDLLAVVTQNSREDTEVRVSKPLYVGGTKLQYEHDPTLIFPAGNEYRRFETVNTNTINMGVQGITYFEPYYHAILRTDEVRAEEPYLYDKTQFGRFTIRNAAATRHSNTESDYLVTHFTLNTGEQLTGGNIFLQGEFTEGMPATSTVMKYDPQERCYTCDMLLKQGAYNYQFVWVLDGTDVGLTGKIEGDKYQTVNEYLVKIYYHPSGERYDRCIGYGVAYSGK